MLVYNIPISGTASSGTFSQNTVKLDGALIKQIIVKAATATTTFSAKIEDRDDNIIYQTDTKATGTLREEVEIPTKDINTITIENASADEAFTGKLVVFEKN